MRKEFLMKPIPEKPRRGPAAEVLTRSFPHQEKWQEELKQRKQAQIARLKEGRKSHGG